MLFSIHINFKADKMKKIHLLTILSLLLLSIIACNKESTTPFRIIDAATKEPIPNATVALFEKESNGILTSPSRTLVEVVESDAEGHYDFTYSLSGDRTYDVSVDADTYWQSTRNSYPRTPTIEMDPEGYVKVKVRKVDTTEYARVNINDGIGITFTGRQIDTSFLSIKRGNFFTDFVWGITITGETTTYVGEEFFVPPHDTTTFEIIF